MLFWSTLCRQEHVKNKGFQTWEVNSHDRLEGVSSCTPPIVMVQTMCRQAQERLTCHRASITVARSDLGYTWKHSHMVWKEKKKKARGGGSRDRIAACLPGRVIVSPYPHRWIYLTLLCTWAPVGGTDLAGAARKKDMTQNGTVAGNGTQADALKIVIVGDGGCGKTSLLMVYAKGDFPEVRFLIWGTYKCSICLTWQFCECE